MLSFLMKANVRRKIRWKVFAMLALFTLHGPSVEAVREEKINKIEVFVSTYCYRINKVRGPEILILKRATNRELFPNAWECGGGSVHENEDFESAAKRQLREEAGISASRWRTLECFKVEVKSGVVVPGLAFSCKANSDEHVKIDPREHSDYRWVTINELDNIIFVSQQMRQTIVKLLMVHDKLL
jgi:8-oxo-dGTP pyrophosphatase MutT (NUDIX family)